MARRKRKKKSGPKAKKGIRGTKVKIKGHSRSPRGPNAGKKPVRVKPHTRKKPRKKA